MRKLVLLSPLLLITLISLINTRASRTNSQLTVQPSGKNAAAIKGIVTTSGDQPVSKAIVSPYDSGITTGVHAATP